VKDFQIDMEEVDINNLFKAFDYNEDGTVDFDEFLRIVVGPMNRFRENLINKVFDKLDRTEDGVVDIDDIRGIYDGSRHPDVKNGKKT
jgi:Ca2+-binding EF-hand superfamily protein